MPPCCLERERESDQGESSSREAGLDWQLAAGSVTQFSMIWYNI